MVSHQELHSSILAFILSRHQSSSLMISHKCHQLVHHALGLFQSLPRIERFTPSRQLCGFHLFYAYNIFTGALFYRLIVTGCLTSRGSQPHDSLLAYLFTFMSTLMHLYWLWSGNTFRPIMCSACCHMHQFRRLALSRCRAWWGMYSFTH